MDGDGVVKLFGQRLRALLQDASLREDAPPAPPDLRAGAKGTIFVLVWLLLRSVVRRHRVEIAVGFWVTISGSHLCCWGIIQTRDDRSWFRRSDGQTAVSGERGEPRCEGQRSTERERLQELLRGLQQRAELIS